MGNPPNTPGNRWGFVSRLVALCLLLSAGALAHIMSMSRGELGVEGSTATYELQMPLYEITHLEKPETTLLDNFRLISGSDPLRRKSGSCKPDELSGMYICKAAYESPEPIDQLDVECNFAAVTVPNHIHILRAVRGDVVEQAVFDFSFTRSTIRFAPPTATEKFLSQLWAGSYRVLSGPFQILFLAALVLAGRQRRELLWLALAFLIAQSISAVVVVGTSWQPPPRFTEAAAALTVAYLAIEILILPDAGYRWVVAAAMGVFHGFYFGTFLQQTAMDSLYVLSGVALANVLLLFLFALALARLKKAAAWLRPVQAGAVVLFLIGMAWFVLRVRS